MDVEVVTCGTVEYRVVICGTLGRYSLSNGLFASLSGELVVGEAVVDEYWDEFCWQGLFESSLGW